MSGTDRMGYVTWKASGVLDSHRKGGPGSAYDSQDVPKSTVALFITGFVVAPILGGALFIWMIVDSIVGT